MTKKTFTYLIFSLLISAPYALYASQDSLKVLIQTAVKTEVTDQLSWFYTVFGIAALAITGYALYLWLRGIKKQAEQVIQTKTAALVEKEVSAITGARTDTIRAYFQQYQTEQDLLAKQAVYVVFQPKARQQELVAYLREKGFLLTEGVTVNQPLTNLKVNDLLVFDDNAENFSDEDIDKYAETYATRAKFVYYGPRRYAGKYKMANFANTQATLANRLKDIILSA
jgi:hypothetical protein